MFGNDSQPSRVFKFGAYIDASSIEAVRQQMFLMHRYRNRLCEIELARRAAVDAATREICPELATCEAAIAEAEARLESSLTAKRAGLILPEWFAERTKSISAWKSQNRMAGLMIHWRNNRFAGDDAIFAACEGWRQQDKHVYEIEGNIRYTDQLWRKDLYRNVAARLSRKYEVAYIEDVDWRTFNELPDADMEPDDAMTATAGARRLAAVSIFNDAIMKRMRRVVKVDPKNTTQLHGACGKVMGVDAAPSVEIECPHCGAMVDQDVNAAENLLRIGSGDVVMA